MKTSHASRLTLLLLPWLLLLGMVFFAYLPIFSGKKYVLAVKLYDPRDFFRGNYVALSFDFTRIKKDSIKTDIDTTKRYQFGDTLTLDLEEQDGVLKPIGLYEDAAQAQHVRLNARPRWTITKDMRTFELVTGLESFFTPPGDAVQWEKALREGEVFAELAIDTRGNSRLIRLFKVGPKERNTR